LQAFSKREYGLLVLAGILLLPALLLNLGLVPLYAEEPRRAVVAMEMIFRHNWLIPTIHGEYYHLKPPFFNWILGFFYTLAGSNSEFITRLPTVISLVIFSLVIFLIGKKYVSREFGLLTSLLFAVAGGNLFFNSLLAEIDMFYSLVTYSGMICLFHFHQRGQYYKLFLSVYFLGAIGVLTKGVPSLLFTGLSILVYFTVNREFKKLFRLPHFAGISFFLLLVGGYFFAYQMHGDTLFYFKNLTNESSKRFTGYNLMDYFFQMLKFPLETLQNLFPGSLLLIFIFRKSFYRTIKSNPLVKFAFLMVILHFPIYWLPPGSRQRYVIMLYPFLLQIMAYFYVTFKNREPGRNRFVNLVLIVLTGIFMAGSLVLPFIEKLDFIRHLTWISVLTFILLAAIFIFQLKYRATALAAFILAMVTLKITFSQLILPVRTMEGNAYANKKAAFELLALTEGIPAGIFHGTYFPMQCTYYIERERQEILPIYHDVIPGNYHIVQKILLTKYSLRRDIGDLMQNPFKPFSDPYSRDDEDIFNGVDYQVIHTFELQKRKYLLVNPVRQHP